MLHKMVRRLVLVQGTFRIETIDIKASSYILCGKVQFFNESLNKKLCFLKSTKVNLLD